MTDDELQAILGGRVSRRRAPFASSFVLEEVSVEHDDGRRERLVLKNLARSGLTPAGAGAKPSWLLDPAREVEAYRDVLSPLGLGVPELRAWGEHWLLQERVAGTPLWQHGMSAWEAAARWLADLHRFPAPTGCRHLVSYDAPYLDAWLDRARALTPAGSLDPVAAVWPQVVARLAAEPLTIVHGDFHASNVLVDPGPRIRPVDWELAGVGPGLIDLAALVSGDWTAEERGRIERAYAGDRGHTGLLEHARLYHAVQWLGWSGEWSPPAEHAHDWLADALDAAKRIDS